MFQRLDDLADLFVAHLDRDVRAAVGQQWEPLLQVWATRHVFTHCDGFVDEKYLSAVSTAAVRVGQRLQLDERYSRDAVERVEYLCRVLSGDESSPMDE